MVYILRTSAAADIFICLRCACSLFSAEKKGWRGFHAENFIVLGLFGLIFHDLIAQGISECGLKLMDFPFHCCIHKGAKLSKSHPALSLRQKMLDRIQLLDKTRVRAACLIKPIEN